MRKHIFCILVGAALLAACEKTETTINPPAENKTENNTTIVKESPAPVNKTESKTETTTTTTSSPNP
jgi:hypothetical protein